MGKTVWYKYTSRLLRKSIFRKKFITTFHRFWLSRNDSIWTSHDWKQLSVQPQNLSLFLFNLKPKIQLRKSFAVSLACAFCFLQIRGSSTTEKLLLCAGLFPSRLCLDSTKLPSSCSPWETQPIENNEWKAQGTGRTHSHGVLKLNIYV